MVRKFTGSTGSKQRDMAEEKWILLKAKRFVQALSEEKKIKARTIADPVSAISKLILKHERLIGKGLIIYQ